VEFKVEEIKFDGLSVKYLRASRKSAGQAEAHRKPLLFLHGWGGNKFSWQPLMENLGEDFEMVSVDLPGFGESSVPEIPWDLNDYVNFVNKFAEAMAWEHGFDLVVHSFGGRIAIKMAQGLNSVTKAVFIAAAGIKHPLSARSKIAHAVGMVGKKVFSLPLIRRAEKPARKILYKLLGVHDYEKTEGVMKKIFLNVIAEDLKDQIELVKWPVLLIWGDQDSYVPVADAFYMQDHIKSTELKIIEGGRHGIHKTFPDKLAKWIKEFLTK